VRRIDATRILSHLLIVMKAATWNHDGAISACATANAGRTGIACERASQPMFVVDSTE
jgi:hypothetical protein